MDLTVIWAFIIAFAVFAYVVMDGFDLGIGILFPAFAAGQERDRAMNSIAPVWDGNETWLVLGGGGLFAAFPLAYAVILPATYPLIIAMLLGLVFRGVAFEYRWRDPDHRGLWDVAFFGGSLVEGMCQGLILGALLVLVFTGYGAQPGARAAMGLLALTNLTKLFGDVLSYLRLFALGLASASLAIAFNSMAADVHTAFPGTGLLFAILILILGHGLNFVLGMAGAVIHGLRLNLLEFFDWGVK